MFYIGQRVKLVKPFSAENLGIEGTIHSFEFTPKGYVFENGQILPSDCNCTIFWDKFAPDLHCVHTDQLEPIQKPPQPILEASHWDEMPCDRQGKYREKEKVT